MERIAAVEADRINGGDGQDPVEIPGVTITIRNVGKKCGFWCKLRKAVTFSWLF